MPRRSTSLNNLTGTAIFREIDSKYDVVKEVSNNLVAIESVADAASDVAVVASNDANITITSENIADVNTVAASIADVSTTATSIADVNTTATNVANVNLVGSSIDNVNAVGTGISNVNLVGADITNVNLVGTDIANVNAIATSIDDVNYFAETYYGPLAIAPTISSHPSLTIGDMYFDTSLSVPMYKVYRTTGWGFPFRSTINKETIIATAGQTAFVVPDGYTAGYLDVLRNGADLADTDYIATDGVNVTLLVGADVNDVVVFKKYDTFSADSGDMLSTNNLSDVASAVTSRTNLGVGIGTDVQAYDANIVSDSAYVHTDNNYDSVAKGKIDNVSVTQPVDLDIIESRVNALDTAITLQGSWDASGGVNFPTSTLAGETWIVSIAGTVDSIVFNVNDRVLALVDTASTTVYATNWLKLDYTDNVLSVNTKTGTVVVTPDDLDDSATTNKFVTATDVTNLSNLSGTNTGDQDLSGLVLTDSSVALATPGALTATGTTVTLAKGDGTTDTIITQDTTYLIGDGGLTEVNFTSADSIKLNGIEALADVTATNETSHGDVLVDGDFVTAGLMKTDGAGVYSIDTSAYLTSESDPVFVASEANNITATDIANLGSLSGTNTGDQILPVNSDFSFDGLSDTAIDANTSGEILRWSGVSWVNSTLAEASISDTLHVHTGVYEPADATIVKDADIGVTVQAYDGILAATTASYTTAEETKLSGAAELSGAQFVGLVAYSDTVFDTNIDCSLGNSFSKTLTADFIQTFSNVPAAGNSCVVVLKLTDAGAWTITWSTAIKWAGGSVPIFTSSGTDSVVLYTIDGGTSWYANVNIGYA